MLVGLLPPLLYAAAVRTSLVDFRANTPAILCCRSGSCSSRRSASAGHLVAAAGAVRGRRSRSARWSPRRTPSPPPPSPAGSACPAGSSPSSRASRWSTTRPPWCLCGPPVALAGGLRQRRLRVGRRLRSGPRWAGSSVGVVVALAGRAGPPQLDRPGDRHALSFMARSWPTCPPRSCGASGVLAVVVAGLLLGHKAPLVQSAASRLSERINWPTIQFLLENAVFLLIGLQVRRIVADVSAVRPRRLADRRRAAWPCSPPWCCCGRSGSSRPATLVIRPGPRPRRPGAAVALHGDHLLGRHARGGDAGGGVRPARGHPAPGGAGAVAMVVTAGTPAAAGVLRCPGWPVGSACTGPTRARTRCRRRPSEAAVSAGLRHLDECADESTPRRHRRAAASASSSASTSSGSGWAGPRRRAGDAERALPAAAAEHARGRARGGAAHPRRRGGRPRGARPRDGRAGPRGVDARPVERRDAPAARTSRCCHPSRPVAPASTCATHPRTSGP